MLNDTDFALLKRVWELYRREETLPLSKLVKELGKSPSYLSERLGRLAEEGWLRREHEPTAQGRIANFAPGAGLMVRWVSQDEPVAKQWVCHGEIDWRYPLVSQVPDEQARDTLTALFDQLRQEHLLDPRRIAPSERPGSVEDETNHMGLSIIVYGSCARGHAQPGSDVDLIVVQAEGREREGGEWVQDAVDVEDQVREIVANVGLHTPRSIQVLVERVDTVPELPPQLLRALANEGLVVYDGLRSKPGGSTRGIWRYLEELRDDQP